MAKPVIKMSPSLRQKGRKDISNEAVIHFFETIRYKARDKMKAEKGSVRPDSAIRKTKGAKETVKIVKSGYLKFNFKAVNPVRKEAAERDNKLKTMIPAIPNLAKGDAMRVKKGFPQ
ncbi:MAG: hypothetical protein CVU05_12625 [Bacteroidetes bacterium HGW-Bacteroidetes-21]|jgi:cobyric acid synthase|nr:MAG: hypothetical protein CVU05_12625 [Bacteroidetes bacterium HGW-Bacteroidetes-21]